MNSFYYDLILSGLTYVLLTYLAFTLMRSRKRTSGTDNNDGGISIDSGPKIDLPPGIVWPDGSGGSMPSKELERETY
ncbi:MULTISPECIES: hypothetical protein [Roseivirga]|jgi:hypothetical protein|uniref:Uncharacterized protein n=1 Tax=Roseivirga spongicola TaxID=333140 RepID=A0A150XGJ1_9BACT|nr:MULTISPECIES: hypothetical protein [Roseivirga]KYG77827.1 hypothetical protein AWW68_03405 [Roseivirga spongicola]MBO6494201.1 hypothetical protein [Roseivirga sp.]WPZ11555.1 hypothetical protein T7867_05480 [Roseivirga spongicola]|tara:strand:- start:50 stop:280 length:231 start_codon:yes stop_codon:yes gene_type:complete